MSYALMNTVCDEIEADSNNEQFLLLIVAKRCDNSGQFFASVDFLSHQSGISRRLIQTLKKKWLDSGAITLVGKFFPSSRKIVRCSPTDTDFRKGVVPVYRLTLSVFPRKKKWSELRGISFDTEHLGDNQFHRSKIPIPPCQPGTGNDSPRVQTATSKGAPGDTLGCTESTSRVQTDATHNKADKFDDKSVDEFGDEGPLPDPASAAHHVLTQINLRGIATLAIRAHLDRVASAIEAVKLQNPKFTYAEIATGMIDAAIPFSKTGKPNWFAFWADGLYMRRTEVKINGSDKAEIIETRLGSTLSARRERRVASGEAGIPAGGVPGATDERAGDGRVSVADGCRAS